MTIVLCSAFWLVDPWRWNWCVPRTPGTAPCCVISQRCADLMWRFGDTGLGLALYGPVQGKPFWCFICELMVTSYLITKLQVKNWSDIWVNTITCFIISQIAVNILGYVVMFNCMVYDRLNWTKKKPYWSSAVCIKYCGLSCCVVWRRKWSHSYRTKWNISSNVTCLGCRECCTGGKCFAADIIADW
jgi:hypothetical protein